MIINGNPIISDSILKFSDSEIHVDIEGIRFYILLDRNFFSRKHILSFLRHKHGAIEIFFVHDGQGEMSIGNKTYELSKNRIYIVNKGSYHCQSIHNTIEGYSFQFRYEVQKPAESVFAHSERNLFLERLNRLRDCILEDEYDCCDTIEKIHQEMREMKFGFYNKIQTYFVQIIIHILRMYQPKNPEKIELEKKSPEQSRTEIIDNFFYDNFDKRCGIDDPASLVGVSSRQLNRILKELYGYSFKQMIMEMRVEVAKDYLIHTDVTVSDISYIVGYTEPSNFCAVFKKATGISPGAYRKHRR